MSPEAHPQADAVLARRASSETDRGVWSTILSRLRRNKSDRYLPALARGMDVGRDRDRINTCEQVLKTPEAGADLRARAVRILTDYGLGKVKKDTQYQSSAMLALCRTDLQAAWPVVSQILVYQRGHLRSQAWRAMTRYWSGKPEAAEMAKRLRLDGELGDRADAYLKQHGG